RRGGRAAAASAQPRTGHPGLQGAGARQAPPGGRRLAGGVVRSPSSGRAGRRARNLAGQSAHAASGGDVRAVRGIASTCPPEADRATPDKVQLQLTPMSFTILLVEDDFDVREALAETLREEGYAVDCACDGEEALQYLREGRRPGLILLD